MRQIIASGPTNLWMWGELKGNEVNNGLEGENVREENMATSKQPVLM